MVEIAFEGVSLHYGIPYIHALKLYVVHSENLVALKISTSNSKDSTE